MSTPPKPLLILPVIALAGLAFLILRNRPSPPEPSRATNPPTASTSDDTASAPGAKQRHYRPEPVSESVQRQADEVIRRHQGMKKEEFEKSAELQELGRRFFGHLDSPAFQKKLKEAIELMKSTKGIEHGTLSFDLHDLNSPNARAWVEAALSDEPERARSYVLNLLDGAVFEFALDPAAETTSDGLTVKGSEAAPISESEE
jgi:hypothetical protein